MPSLLIIDDSTTARKMIMAALRSLNPNFSEASSGLEAIEQLSLRTFDALTLDMNMPDMHGLEFLSFIRSHSRLKEIPVVVVTTRSDAGIKNQVMSAGANAYVQKPFRPDELLHVIESLIKS